MKNRHPYDVPVTSEPRSPLPPRKPAPFKRPLPLPRTEGLMPMVCEGCIFEKCCTQSQAHGGHGQRYCRLVPDVRFDAPDQLLLRLIDRWWECHAEMERLETIAEGAMSAADETAAEAGMRELWEGRWKRIEERIIATPARKADGARAKAALAEALGGWPPSALLASIARDRQAGLLR